MEQSAQSIPSERIERSNGDASQHKRHRIRHQHDRIPRCKMQAKSAEKSETDPHGAHEKTKRGERQAAESAVAYAFKEWRRRLVDLRQVTALMIAHQQNCLEA